MIATASHCADRPPVAARWQPLPGATAVRQAAPAPLAVRYFSRDASVFVDGEYLIKGVAGAIFWKLARRHAEEGRADFTTRELRRAADELRLPDVKDNLDVRLLLLLRRLAERGDALRIERTARGRYRFVALRPLALQLAA